MSKVKKIAVTGGIGTGKSAVVNQLGTYPGIMVIKTDDLAKQIGKENPNKVYQIVGFPVNFDKADDLKKLSQRLFSENSEVKKEYERFIHPLVDERIERLIKNAPSSIDVCLIESALVFETETESNYDDIVIVTADKDIRIERLVNSRHNTEEEALSIMSCQNAYPSKDKKYKTIDNSGDMEDLKENVHGLYLKLMNAQPKQKALYAGSFDPPTLGHKWVIDTAQKFFEVEIAIAINPEKKAPLFSFSERKAMIERLFPGLVVKSFQNEFTVDVAKKLGADLLIRGIRNTSDFSYEQTVYNVNKLFMPELETVFLVPEKYIGEVSSSMVKGIVGPEHWEERILNFVDPYISNKLKEKIIK